MSPRRFSLVLAAFLLAGCSDESPPSTDDPIAPTSSTSGPAGNNSEDSPQAPDIGLVDEGHWTDCWGIYSHFIWPGNMAPGSYPEGWEASEQYYATEVRVMVAECSRISWGNLERGPVRFLFEYHNNHGVPEACQADSGPIQYWILNSLWVDDEQVATELRDEEGLPTVFGAIELAKSDVGALVHWTASWEGGSKLESFQEAPSSMVTSIGAPKRIFWENHLGGITRMDFAIEALTPPYSDRVTTGSMQDPMLMADVGDGYAASGGTFDGGVFAGELARFRDLQCAEPL